MYASCIAIYCNVLFKKILYYIVIFLLSYFQYNVKRNGCIFHSEAQLAQLSSSVSNITKNFNDLIVIRERFGWIDAAIDKRKLASVRLSLTWLLFTGKVRNPFRRLIVIFVHDKRTRVHLAISFRFGMVLIRVRGIGSNLFTNESRCVTFERGDNAAITRRK